MGTDRQAMPLARDDADKNEPAMEHANALASARRKRWFPEELKNGASRARASARERPKG
jgi:hypothetical protein